MRTFGVISATALFLLLGIGAAADARQDRQEENTKPAKQDQQQAKPEKQQQAKPEQQQHAQQQAKGQQDQQKQQQEHAQQQANSDKQQQQHAQQQAKGQQDQQKQQQQHAQQQANSDKQQQQHSQQQANVQQQQHSNQQAHYQPAKMQSSQEQHRQEGEQRGIWEQRRANNWQSEHRDWQQRGGYNGYRIPDDRYNSYFGSGHSFRIYSYPVMIVGGYPRFQYGGYWFAMADPWPEYWSENWYDNDDVYIDYSDGGYYMYNRRYPRDRIAIEVYLN